MSIESATSTATPESEGRGRLRRRLGQLAGAVALVLIPLVMHAAPAGAAGTTAVWMETNSSTGTTLGLSIFANANLSSSGTLTGTVTFQAFGPADATCASPAFTSTVPVSGNPVNSARFTPAHAGTYRWTSTYSGDATHAAAGPTQCGDPSATVNVSRASTNLSTAAASSTPTAIHATATLIGGIRPTGTITFTLTGPKDMFCGGTPAFTSTVAVDGAGNYDSGMFSPARSGDYTWRAIYSGDSDHLGTAITPCLNSDALQTVTAAPPSGDFDGIGKTQLSLFRPNTGVWYIQNAVGGAINQLLWGQSGDIPVPGDYNADGRTDIAVYRPSTGQWLVKGISDTVYGANGDIPVPGDYNGDGKTDPGVWRPANGTWYVKGMFEKVLGQTGDVPQPGDYDGDGRTDPTVFRPDPGTWFLSQTTAGPAQSPLGVVGDVVTSLVGVVSSLVGLLGH